ncbi:hypothetical protein ACWDUX_30090 [Streptomyces sp. NPDC003444]
MAEEIRDWNKLNSLAQKVAREVASKWPIVEVEDVKQEIMLHALEEQKNLTPIQDNEELLRRVFWTSGRRYAAKERAHLDLMDNEYYYVPNEVRTALRSFLYTDEEIGARMGQRDDLTRCVISDNILTARLDTQRALPRLSEDYQELITRQYIYGLPARDDAERRRGYRAVDALTRQMNRTIRTGK